MSFQQAWMTDEATTMALQLGALRDALIDAGAKPEIAGKAAEELAAYDDRFDSLERTMLDKFAEAERSTSERFAESDRVMAARFAEVDRRFTEVDRRFTEADRRFAGLDTRIACLEERMEAGFQRQTWMTGTLILLVVGVLGRLLFVR